MPGLSAWAVRRPVIAVISWFFLLGLLVFGGLRLGGEFNDSFDLPDTESTAAFELLSQSGADSGSLEGGATIVWSPSSGSAVDPEVLGQVLPVLESFSTLSSVSCVSNPVGASFGRGCAPTPDQPSPEEIATFPAEIQTALGEAARSFSTISPDGKVAYSTITFAGDGQEVSASDAKTILSGVTALNSPALQVGAGGQALEFAGQEPPSSEAIGIVVAIIILLIAFGSIIAAGMPIVVAIVGLAGGQMFVLISANFLDVATFAPTLAAMIGLGVGIDYALFVLNRYRQALLVGHPPKQAAYEAVETAGRAVVFAGSAVIIALLGLFVMGINFFNGIAVAASLTVVMVMLSAVWMLPAVLSLLGTKALGLRLPWGKKPGEGKAEGRAWAHYGRIIQRRPIIPALLSLGLVVMLALPVLGLRQGFADDSGKPEGSSARIAFDLRSEGFGPGVNGPFLIVAELPTAGDIAAYSEIVTTLSQTPGVARTQPSPGVLPLVAADPAQFGVDGTVVAIGVVPDSSPQDERTSELLERLRSEVNPAITASTGAVLYVGGSQAITSDFTDVLASALPIFLIVVVGLGFLALVLLFHSIVVPLTAAITSLLSLAAALGITVAVFQWGWFNDLLGVPGTGPIFPFVPIMVFAILFGLSMDYQVFLVSRMQEEWAITRDNAASVRRGLAGSGRVVVIAAAIMSSVFLAFVPSTDPIIKLFGVALASAVLIDAFIVRLILVPSLMSMIGPANWWVPGWLDRILPNVRIEPGADEVADDELVSPRA
jgi:RND superfamily putative drug exporter